jgi:hypothetical protein
MGGACATYADSILVGKLSDRDHLEDLGLDGKIILKRMFKKLNGVGHGLDCGGSGWRQVAGACECGNEPSCVWTP